MKTHVFPILAMCLLINTEHAISQNVKSLKKIAIVNFHASTTKEIPLSAGDIPRTEREAIRFLCSQKILNHSYHTMVNELNAKGIHVIEYDKTEAIAKNILGVKSQEETNKQNIDSASEQADQIRKNHDQVSQPEADKPLAEKMKNLTREQQALLMQYGRESMMGASQIAEMLRKLQSEENAKQAMGAGKTEGGSFDAVLNGDAPCPHELSLSSSPNSPCNYHFAKQTYYAGQIYGRLPCNKKAGKSDVKIKKEKFKQYLDELKKEGAEAYMVIEIFNGTDIKSGIGKGELYSTTKMSVAVYDLMGSLIYTNTRATGKPPKSDGVAASGTTLYGVIESSEGVQAPVKNTDYNDQGDSVKKTTTYEYTPVQELMQNQQSSEKAVKTTVVQLLSGE